MKRLCSQCHLPGHTKSSHKERKNPEFFRDANGVVHPLRKSYEGKKSWGGAYSPVLGHDYESKRELAVGRRGRKHVRTGRPRGGRRAHAKR